MANNENSPETFHEVPASKYWYLGDVIGAVPKGFFKVWTPTIIIISVVTTVLALETNFWQWFFSTMVSFFLITHWYIGWPTLLIASGVAYIWYSKRRKRILRERRAQAHTKAYQDALIRANMGVKTKNDE